MNAPPRELQDWECPFCRRGARLANSATSGFVRLFQLKRNSQPALVVQHLAMIDLIECPNPECGRVSARILRGSGSPHRLATSGDIPIDADKLNLRIDPPPTPAALPKSVPSSIVSDRREAYLIVQLSPKAAATLARRALQTAIRDCKGIERRTLYEEIDALRSEVDEDLWAALHGAREVGNVGAHMRGDVNAIVDVDPSEAVRLLELLELVLDEWYVQAERRTKLLAEVRRLGESKARRPRKSRPEPTAP